MKTLKNYARKKKLKRNHKKRCQLSRHDLEVKIEYV